MVAGVDEEEKKVENMDRGFVKTDSFNIAYRQWGTSGKPIVLLHGIPMNSTLWHHTGTVLSEHGYLVYAPELLGLGYTEGPRDYDHSLRGQAQLVDLFVNSVIGDECILVGHDLGGGVAQIIITELTTKVEKCVLTNCVAFDSWPIREIEVLIRGASKGNGGQDFTPEFVLNFLKRGLAASVIDPSVVTDGLVGDLQQGLVGTIERREHFVSFLRAMNNECTQEASPKLVLFRKSALLVWARDDQFQPVTVGERLRNVLPHATWKTIDGKHFHPLETTALADAVRDWDAGLVDDYQCITAT